MRKTPLRDFTGFDLQYVLLYDYYLYEIALFSRRGGGGGRACLCAVCVRVFSILFCAWERMNLQC